MNSGVKYYYHPDHLGSIRKMTNQAGEVVYEADYLEFGEMFGVTGTITETHGFTGKEWDADLQLYYYNARWYEPTTGRFISEDPIKDGINWYVYCVNNPVILMDLNGLEPSSFNYVVQKGDSYLTLARNIMQRSGREWLQSIAESSLDKEAKGHADAYRIVKEVAEAIEADLGIGTLKQNQKLTLGNTGYYVPRLALKNSSNELIQTQEQVLRNGGIIVLDPGHGGSDPGCIYPLGSKNPQIIESETVRILAKYLYKGLQDDYDVYSTRSLNTNEYKSLQERWSFANLKDADLFISLHVNSAAYGTPSGMEAFITTTSVGKKSDAFLKILENKLKRRGFKFHGDNFRKVKNFDVINFTKMPAILIEIGFFLNEEERINLQDEDYLKSIADVIEEAVDEFF